MTALLLLGMSGGVEALDTTNPEPLPERSQASARAMLDRAVEALGGKASLRAIETVRYRSEGETWERLQAPTVLPPFEAGKQEQTVLLDLVNNRMRADLHENAAGMERNNTTVLNKGSAVTYNHRSRVATPASGSQASQQFVLHSRRLPQLLLRQALDNVGTLRYLRRDDFAGKPHDVIAFGAPAESVSLYVDVATNRVSKYEMTVVDPLTGDDVSEALFDDYSPLGRHVVPRTWITREAGEITGKFQVRTEINPAVSDASFGVPFEGYTSADATPAPMLEEQVEQMADGVFAMRNIARRDLHSLAVAFKDYILVVEAPWTSEGADRLIARIKQAIPGKPIRYVAITHHHGDHVGGLRSFIAEGATVITTPGNRGMVEALARAPLLDRLRKEPRKPEILIITDGRHVLSDGSRTVELIDIGPNPHAQEIVVAYLPQERLLFEADIFLLPYTPRPLGPPQATTRSFANRLRELDLDVDRIVATHGRAGTAAELATWILEYTVICADVTAALPSAEAVP